jgi:uncharacterized membrane protein HdeD (DUF308 family)
MSGNVGFVITLIRGILAVSLGVMLLFQPEKTRPMLANFMGMFWLVSGIFSLRWGASGERAQRVAIIAGVVGVLAGISMLTRGLMVAWIREDILLSLLGVVILLTGILHAFGGFQTGKAHRRFMLTSLLLGAFEIVLGFVLIVEPMGRSYAFYLIVSIWALIGGFILITNAILLRRAHKESERDTNS